MCNVAISCAEGDCLGTGRLYMMFDPDTKIMKNCRLDAIFEPFDGFNGMLYQSIFFAPKKDYVGQHNYWIDSENQTVSCKAQWDHVHPIHSDYLSKAFYQGQHKYHGIQCHAWASDSMGYKIKTYISHDKIIGFHIQDVADFFLMNFEERELTDDDFVFPFDCPK